MLAKKTQDYFSAPDRAFKQFGQWYFRTREDYNMGPYRSVEETENAIDRYIKERIAYESARQQLLSLIENQKTAV